jgi:hypothetical protein
VEGGDSDTLEERYWMLCVSFIRGVRKTVSPSPNV